MIKPRILMIENIIKGLQKFLNKPFYYHELKLYINKQEDLLLQKHSLEELGKREYNAIWDTLLFFETYFEFAGESIIGTTISVSKLYHYFHGIRCD